MTNWENKDNSVVLTPYNETIKRLMDDNIKLKEINAELLCSLKTIVELKESSEESFPSVYKIAKEIINRAEGRL